MVHFSATYTHDTNNSAIGFVIRSGGTQVAASERPCTVKNATQVKVIHSMAIVTVNGSQAIDVYWNTSVATATCNQRQLLYTKVA